MFCSVCFFALPGMDKIVHKESADSELTYQVTYISDSRCGISLDNHWINLAPQANWLGFCDVTVVVNDSLKTTSDTFRINIQSVMNRIHLPNISK